MNLFRIRGIQLAVHFSFFLLLAFNAYWSWVELGGDSVLWQTAALLACFVCVVLHELGHCFTAMHYGIGVRRILLMPIGGMAEFDSIPREPRREVWITVAGPAVNFAIAAGLWLALPPIPDSTDRVTSWLEFGHLVLQWNLLMGCFNFLPAFPMDGGRLLRATLATRLSYLRATYWAATIGKGFCMLGFIAAAYFEKAIPMLLFLFIYWVGEMEYRAEERRDREEAYLRAAGVRRDGGSSPLEPPALLRPEQG